MHQHRRSPFVRWFIIMCIIFMVLAVFAPFVTYIIGTSTPVAQ